MKQLSLLTQHGKDAHPARLLPIRPDYATDLGAAYVTDSLNALRQLADGSVNLVLTSPPYSLHFQKHYGNVAKDKYADWFLEFGREIFRVLPSDGSFVLNIGGSYNKGTPTRSLYHFKLLIRLVEEVGFHLAQECFWYNPAKMPMPAEWVTVRKVRIKDAVEYVWWLSKTPWPKASNRKVLRQGLSADMYRLNRRGIRETTRPGGYKIRQSWAEIKSEGAIPANFIDSPFQDDVAESALIFGNNSANDPYTLRCKEHGVTIHPARFPRQLPEFFIRFLTDEDDIVLDPFAGSNTTGAVAESLDRRWLAFDVVAEYIRGSRFRFDIEDAGAESGAD